MHLYSSRVRSQHGHKYMKPYSHDLKHFMTLIKRAYAYVASESIRTK
jgi:hypothetical protein